MKYKEFKEKLDLLLTGELTDDQISALERYALQDANAAIELDQVKKLRAALYRTARDYRQTSYPGDLAADVIERAASRTTSRLFVRHWAYALAALLVVISSLLLIYRPDQPQHHMFSGYPSISIMGEINSNLTDFKIENSRQLSDWSIKTHLSTLDPGRIDNTEFWMPDRPATIDLPSIETNNQEGV